MLVSFFNKTMKIMKTRTRSIVLILLCVTWNNLWSAEFYSNTSSFLRDEKIKPYQDSTVSDELRIKDLIERMTLEEKIDLLAGYQDFYLHPCERLGIPAFKLADGPLGLSSWGLFGKATAFPSSLSIAASWNRNLAGELGMMYAQEWRARGIHFLLAPGVNIYRASKGARNFEYYGEDPFLSSAMVVPFIKSVQDGGVIATIKHYAVNDQEFDRYTVSSEIDERTLHEIYLPPFKAAVQKAGVKAVMTGYNPVNGVYCTENKKLIDILKKDWGFNGMLMSDWACTYSAIGAANNGLDLEMGSKSWFNRGVLIPLIESGDISIDVINDKVRRIYGACIEMGFFDREQKDNSIPTFNPKANRMALDAAREGVILLKNDNSMLPLKTPKVIAVIGPTALSNVTTDRVYNVSGITYGGGGSSKVHPWYVISVLEGILGEFPDSEVLYHEGISNRFKKNLFNRSRFKTFEGKDGLKATYYSIKGSKAATKEELELQKNQAKAAGIDRKVEGTNSSVDANRYGDEVKKLIDRNVNFSWGGSPHGLQELGDNYRVKWEGYIDVKSDDKLLIFVDAQGGYRLWIDGNMAIDAWASQSFHFGQTDIEVRKGDRTKVVLEYRNQRSYPSEIRLGYCYQSDQELDFSEPLRLAEKADAVIFCGGLDGAIEFEGRDRPFDLPFGQDSLIAAIADVNPNTVVNIIAGGGVNMANWVDKVPAILHSLYPGQEGGRAVAEILTGKVNPSAKLPFSIEKRWEDSPAFGNYDETRKERKVYYNETIFTGYRGYDKSQVEPLFPFGYGLSYTTFDYSNLEIKREEGNKLAVSFTITNSGDLAGSEVAQLYIHAPKGKIERALKELKGFEKVYLKSGESKRVTIDITQDNLNYYSTKHKEWRFEKGVFEVWIGSSSKNIRLKDKIKL